MLVAVARAAVAMLATVYGGRPQGKMPVAHAALADRVVGELLHRAGRASQHRDLEAAVVIEMDVHRRDLQVVMALLRLGEPLAELARLVVIDISEGGDSVAVSRILLSFPRLRVAQDVAQRLGPAAVAAP